MTHAKDCVDCAAVVRGSDRLFLVKNAETRESRHVVAPDSATAVQRTGWPQANILFAMVTKIPQINAERRAVRGPRSANVPARPVAEETERETMATKKTDKKRARKPADAFLPDKFTRTYNGKEYAFVRSGDSWRVNGNEPATLRAIMDKLLGKDNARHRSFVGFFGKDHITTPEQARKEAKEAA